MEETFSMSTALQRALVAVLRNADGKPAGAGVLISGDLVLTCAHVVNVALGRPVEEPAKTSSPVLLTFAANNSITKSGATVTAWYPPEFASRVSQLSDLAILR